MNIGFKFYLNLVRVCLIVVLLALSSVYSRALEWRGGERDWKPEFDSDKLTARAALADKKSLNALPGKDLGGAPTSYGQGQEEVLAVAGDQSSIADFKKLTAALERMFAYDLDARVQELRDYVASRVASADPNVQQEINDKLASPLHPPEKLKEVYRLTELKTQADLAEKGSRYSKNLKDAAKIEEEAEKKLRLAIHQGVVAAKRMGEYQNLLSQNKIELKSLSSSNFGGKIQKNEWGAEKGSSGISETQLTKLKKSPPASLGLGGRPLVEFRSNGHSYKKVSENISETTMKKEAKDYDLRKKLLAKLLHPDSASATKPIAAQEGGTNPKLDMAEFSHSNVAIQETNLANSEAVLENKKKDTGAILNQVMSDFNKAQIFENQSKELAEIEASSGSISEERSLFERITFYLRGRH